MALLIATTLLAGPLAGSAAALWLGGGGDNDGDGDAADSIKCGWEIGAGVKYVPTFGLGCEYFDATLESQSSARFAALDLKNESDEDWERINNSLEAERTMAYRIAEAEFIREYKTNGSISDSNDVAKEAVTDYLAILEKNRLVLRSNRYLTKIAEMDQMDGVTVSYGNSNVEFEGMYNETQTLINGSNVNVAHFEQSGTVNNIENHTYYSPNGYSHDVSNYANLEIAFDSGSLSTVALGDAGHYSDWTQLHTELRSIQSEVHNEMDTYANNVSAVDLQQVPDSRLVSPIAQATEFSTEYSTTGSTGFAQALASFHGLSINSSTTYTVEYDGSTYQGTVFGASGDFNGTIETNKTYDGQNLTAWMHVDGTTATVDLDDDFVVTEIVLPNGNTTDSVELATWDMTELDETSPLDLYGQWVENHSALMADNTGAGGCLLCLGGDNTVLIGLGVAAIGVVYVLGRSRNGRTGR
ncbi:MAG: hypothetical protein U5K37_01230 [Natrialbaceae archaeon]|nr:hypothetical protein [Natrialbaceae archaeon]